LTFNGAQKEIFEFTDQIIANGEQEIQRAYIQAAKNVRSQLKNLYLKIQDSGIPKEEYYNYMTKFRRLERLEQSIIHEYSKAYGQAKNITIVGNTNSMTEAFYRNQYLLEWPKDSPQIFTVLDDRVIRTSVFGTAEKWADLVESYGLRNNYVPQANTLLATLKKNYFDNLARIQRTLTQSFLQGTSTNVARSVGLDIERQWLDTGDARTRETHVAADKQIEDKNGQFHVGGAIGPYPGNMSTAAESINCRCSTIDIVEGVSPQLRRATNPLTGESELISFDDYDEYMKDRGMKHTKAGYTEK